MFAILSSLSRVYTIYHSQQYDQGLHYFPFILSSIMKVYTICYSQSDQCLHYLPFSADWSESSLFANLSSLIKVKIYIVIIRNSLIKIYTICHSQQSDQCLHCSPFSAVWSGSSLFDILSLIRVYTICHSQLSDQGLHYMQFSVWSGSKLFAILSMQYYQGLHCLPYSAVW